LAEAKQEELALASFATEGATSGLTTAFLSQALLEAALFAGLQVKAVLFNILADALAFHFSTETAEGLFEGLIVAYGDENQGLTSL
jgi:hypothetical protein